MTSWFAIISQSNIKKLSLLLNVMLIIAIIAWNNSDKPSENNMVHYNHVRIIVYFSFIDDVRLAQRLLLHSHFLLLEFLLTKIDSIHQLLNARICQSEMLSFHFCLKPIEIHDQYNGYLNYVFTPLFYCSYFSLKDELVVVHYLINEYFWSKIEFTFILK